MSGTIGKRETAPRRKACACPPSCVDPKAVGVGAESHSIACRPKRPLCRWRRKAGDRKNGVGGKMCHCDKYHFPHREGSGHCGDDAAYYASFAPRGFRRDAA